MRINKNTHSGLILGLLLSAQGLLGDEPNPKMGPSLGGTYVVAQEGYFYTETPVFRKPVYGGGNTEPKELVTTLGRAGGKGVEIIIGQVVPGKGWLGRPEAMFQVTVNGQPGYVTVEEATRRISTNNWMSKAAFGEARATELRKQEEAQTAERNKKIALLGAIGAVVAALAVLFGSYFWRTYRDRNKPKRPYLRPDPRHAAWLCQSCGWAGLLPGVANPYAVGAAAGGALAGAGVVGTAAGLGGLGVGAILAIIGVVLIVVGIPLIFLVCVGIIPILIGAVLLLTGVIVMVVGGGTAAVGAGAAATGAAGGMAAASAGRAYKQQPMNCPSCKNRTVIPLQSPAGQKSVEADPEVLTPMRTLIEDWERDREAHGDALGRFEVAMAEWNASHGKPSKEL